MKAAMMAAMILHKRAFRHLRMRRKGFVKAKWLEAAWL